MSSEAPGGASEGFSKSKYQQVLRNRIMQYRQKANNDVGGASGGAGEDQKH